MAVWQVAPVHSALGFLHVAGHCSGDRGLTDTQNRVGGKLRHGPLPQPLVTVTTLLLLWAVGRAHGQQLPSTPLSVGSFTSTGTGGKQTA